MKLRPYQEQAIDAIEKGWEEFSRQLLVLPTGCHAAGTPILLHDKSVKNVEDVKVNDRLMGPDGKPRKVLQLARGRQIMYRVFTDKTGAFVVNADHMLSLRDARNGKIENIPLQVYVRYGGPRRRHQRLWRVLPGTSDMELMSFDFMQLQEGDYYGFALDGDHLYLTGDYTVHHNTGKTIVFSHLAAREAQRGGRTLILAHRDELLQQAQDKLKIATGLPSALEKAESRAYSFFDGDILNDAPNVVVGSVQTLSNGRLARWRRDAFDLVVCDEAHHCLADSHRRIIDYFNGARLLGVTATPDRGDKKSLGAIFENIAFEYPMAQAIQDGFLAPIKAKLLPLKIDLRDVRTVAGDYNAADVDAGLLPLLKPVAGAVAENIGQRPLLAFLPLVRTSEDFAGALRCHGITAEHVDGSSPNRADILARFGRGEFQALCNSSLLLEGYDCPDISCIVCLRPTKVRSLYQQMIGRGTRIADGKDDLLVLDFLWQSTEHSLCVPASLFAKSEEECQQMMDIVAAGGGGDGEVDLLDAQVDAKAAREESLARRLREQFHKKSRTINPIEFALSLHDDDLMEYEPTMPWHFLSPTDKQLASLQKAGFDASMVTCRGHASAILDRVFTRSRMNLCTPKQAAVLRKYGYDGSMLSFDDARRIIDRIAANGWRKAV